MKESKIHATERLRQEGRWDEASAYRDEVRGRLRSEGMPKSEADEAAWEAMIERYAPILASEAEPEVTGLDLDDADLDALAAKFDGQPADFSRDAQWTYENLDNRRAAPTAAPSLGAWSMLKWARENRNRFFEHLLPKAISVQQRQATEQCWQEEEEMSIAEIEKMLKELNQEAPVAGNG
jgi:hypothetical protein